MARAAAPTPRPPRGSDTKRAILEAAGVGRRHVSWKAFGERLPADALLITTDQRLGALAVYLCEPESDDGLVEAGLSPTPALGGTFEVLRWLG